MCRRSVLVVLRIAWPQWAAAAASIITLAGTKDPAFEAECRAQLCDATGLPPPIDLCETILYCLTCSSVARNAATTDRGGRNAKRNGGRGGSQRHSGSGKSAGADRPSDATTDTATAATAAAAATTATTATPETRRPCHSLRKRVQAQAPTQSPRQHDGGSDSGWLQGATKRQRRAGDMEVEAADESKMWWLSSSDEGAGDDDRDSDGGMPLTPPWYSGL